MESAGGGVIPMDIELSSDSMPIDGYASAEDSIMSIDVDANMCAIHSSTALNARGVCLRCMTEQSIKGRRSSKKGRRKNKRRRCGIHNCLAGKDGLCRQCTSTLSAENNDASLSTPIPAEKLCPIHNCHADTNGLCRLCDVPSEVLYREPKKCPIHDCLAEQNGLCRECVGCDPEEIGSPLKPATLAYPSVPLQCAECRPCDGYVPVQNTNKDGSCSDDCCGRKLPAAISRVAVSPSRPSAFPGRSMILRSWYFTERAMMVVAALRKPILLCRASRTLFDSSWVGLTFMTPSHILAMAVTIVGFGCISRMFLLEKFHIRRLRAST